MTVLIYVDTGKQVGDPEHLKALAAPGGHCRVRISRWGWRQFCDGSARSWNATNRIRRSGGRIGKAPSYLPARGCRETALVGGLLLAPLETIPKADRLIMHSCWASVCSPMLSW
jgi:hypothetical protein